MRQASDLDCALREELLNMNTYWTGKLAEKLATAGLVFPNYVHKLQKDSVVAMSGVKNDNVTIEFSRHITLCDFLNHHPLLGEQSRDGKAHEPVYEYVHVTPADRSYLEIISFHEDPVEVDFEGDGTRAFATARHLFDRTSSIDVLAREITKLHNEKPFTPVTPEELAFHWAHRFAHYRKHFGTTPSR